MAEKWQGKPQGGSRVWRDKDSLFQSIGSGEIVELWGLQLVPTQSEETVWPWKESRELSSSWGHTPWEAPWQNTQGPTGEKIISEDGQGFFH